MITLGLFLSAITAGVLIIAAIIAIVYVISIYVDNLSELAGFLTGILFMLLLCYLIGGIVLDQLGWIDGTKIGLY